MSMHPQNNRDPNQGVLHFWSKFGESSLISDMLLHEKNFLSWLTHTGDDKT